MKNLRFLVPVLLVLSCTKQVDQDLAVSTVPAQPKLEVCTYDPALLRAGLAASLAESGRRPVNTNPTPTPTPTPTSGGYKCIYVDFDGQTVRSSYWNNGSTISCAPSGLNADQIASVMSKVNAIYAAYNVVITTDESVYLAANQYQRIRVIVTPTSAWKTGVSGISYTGAFTWGNETPSFVFSDRLYYSPGYIGEIVSHEAGHSLGLNHQADYDANCGLVNSYRMGVIMGNSLYVSQGVWTYGTTLSCSIFQDDNQVLTNALGLR